MRHAHIFGRSLIFIFIKYKNPFEPRHTTLKNRPTAEFSELLTRLDSPSCTHVSTIQLTSMHSRTKSSTSSFTTRTTIHISLHHWASEREKNCLTQFPFPLPSSLLLLWRWSAHRMWKIQEDIHFDYMRNSFSAAQEKTSRGQRRNHKIKQSSTFSWVMTIGK